MKRAAKASCRFAVPLLAAFAATGAAAQGLPIPGFANPSKSVPLAIEADKGVEWRQHEQVYVAHGNATARRGDTVIRADRLTAYYRKTSDNRQEIWKISAEGATRITTPKETIHSDSAQYLVETATFTLLGRPVTIESGKNTLTAARVDYNTKSKVAQITGDAVVREEQRRVRADRLVAYFKDGQGKGSLRRVDAIGNVVITGPTEVARGDRGDYDVEAKVATLTGNVKLTRGDNQLNGERAEVDMRTGVSRLLGDATAKTQDGKRVRVLIVPGEGESNEGGNLGIPGIADRPGAKSPSKKP
jgi:lipopolysaccharide export system protein LptA